MVIACSGIFVYFGTFQAPFVYDDAHAIVGNPYIKNLAEFQQVVGIGNLFNRSVLLLSWAVNFALGGENVFGYHLLNVILHVCVSILVYLLAKECMKLDSGLDPAFKKSLPLATTLIHSVNPLSVQAVTYLSSRSALLVTAFYLLSFFCLIRYFTGQAGVEKKPSLLLLVCGILGFVMGAGVKETIVTLPVMVFIYLCLRDTAGMKAGIVKAGALLTGLILLYLGFRYYRLGVLFSLPADPSFQLIPRDLYLFSQIKFMTFYYLLKQWIPVGLNFESDTRLVEGWSDPFVITSLGVLLVLNVAIFRSRQKWLWFAWIWAGICILPTSSIIPLKQVVTEHRAFLPGIGLEIILAGVWLRFSQTIPTVRPVFFSFLIIFSLLTVHRSLDFRSRIQIWEDTLKKSPQKILVFNNLASNYIKEERYGDAERVLQAVLKLNPYYSYALVNLGNLMAKRNDWESAIKKFDEAIFSGSKDPWAFYNAGLARNMVKRYDEAIPLLQRAIRMKSEVPEFYFALGNALMHTKRNDSALKMFRKALALRPEYASAQNNIGVIFWNIKSLDLAEEAFKKSLALEDDSLEGHANLANVYLVQKRYEEASVHLERVLQMKPDDEKTQKLMKIAQTMKDVPQP